MIGASLDKKKFSDGVFWVLHETGYDVIPIDARPVWEKFAA
jgi:predicted CoA-binding protein